MSSQPAIILMSLLLTVAEYGFGQTAAGICLKYEPDVVTLQGTLIRRNFPGPPNYKSTAEGDAPETYWLLSLPSAVCVDGDKSSPELNPAYKEVRRIQLIIDEKKFETERNLMAKQVIVTGTLSGGVTGHHHTPVLLTIKTIGKVE